MKSFKSRSLGPKGFWNGKRLVCRWRREFTRRVLLATRFPSAICSQWLPKRGLAFEKAKTKSTSSWYHMMMYWQTFARIPKTGRQTIHHTIEGRYTIVLGSRYIMPALGAGTSQRPMVSSVWGRRTCNWMLGTKRASSMMHQLFLFYGNEKEEAGCW